ncbi:MAG: hypothetical protein ABH860_06390 [bacterium]
MAKNSKNHAVWMLGGGPMQESAAKKILDMNFKLIITDINPKCICAKYADEFVHLDTFDIKGTLKEAADLKKKYRIKAVAAIAVDCHETVANLGVFLGLPTISPKISRICRYKNLTREALSNAGLPQPRFKTVKTLEKATAFLHDIGGKGVVKATNNSASRGFCKINKPEELNKDAFERALMAGTTGAVLVEEVLQPLEKEISEQSVETVWCNGKMYWLNWVDRLFRKDFRLFDGLKNVDEYSRLGWGVELGHINPAIHDHALKKKIHELIFRAGIAIGMRKEKGGHILKADIMLTPKGPYIIELTPRLSGGWDSSGTTPARGADFIGGAIQLALGKELDLSLWHEYFEYQDPNCFASILTRINPGAKDCIGRKFALGKDMDRERSLLNALKNLKEEKHVLSVV